MVDLACSEKITTSQNQKDVIAVQNSLNNLSKVIRAIKMK